MTHLPTQRYDHNTADSTWHRRFRQTTFSCRTDSQMLLLCWLIRADFYRVFLNCKKDYLYTGHPSSSIVNTRDHSAKIAKNLYQLHLRLFFSGKVIDKWNGLQQGVIDSATMNSFSNGLDTQKTRMVTSPRSHLVSLDVRCIYGTGARNRTTWQVITSQCRSSTTVALACTETSTAVEWAEPQGIFRLKPLIYESTKRVLAVSKISRRLSFCLCRLFRIFC